jgi:cyclopropane fatty-acyl-phospholipid synthase-like methyltransferase
MKEFKAFGVASKMYNNAKEAADDTYTTKDGKLEPTPLIFNDNPFNDNVKNAKKIFEIGFGVGRNVSWIMENTSAHYYGVEPNPTMFNAFWEYNDKKYQDRIHLYKHFNEISPCIRFDIVLSTFVLQHIGYMPLEDTMNVNDIVTNIRTHTKQDTVWIILEHDSEDSWIEQLFNDQDISPDVYIRRYKGIESMTHRDHTTHTGHHLIIWKEK